MGCRRGKRLVLARGNVSSPMALDVSLHSGNSISRVPGIAVYLGEHAFGLPSGFVHVLETVGVVHHTVVFLTVQQVCLPRSKGPESSIACDKLLTPVGCMHSLGKEARHIVCADA